MKLYNFFRSGSSHRLRIALNLKGLRYEYVAVDLRTAQHLRPEFKALNPQGLVPALVHEGNVLIQSPAIIEWLEERPIVKVVTVARAVIDAVQSALVDFERSKLRQPARLSLLQNRHIQIFQAESETFRGKDGPKVSHPLHGVVARRHAGSEDANFTPCLRHLVQPKEVVITRDFLEFR